MHVLTSDQIQHGDLRLYGEPRRYEVELTGSAAMLKTYLLRFGSAEPGAPAVVLLHGGNTCGDTFRIPEGGLVRFLVEQEFDVWTLEWRSSPHVLEPLLEQPPLGGSVLAEVELFTLDSVVKEELRIALELVRDEIGDAELSVLGHCFGSAAVAMAIARGALKKASVSNVVLSTLGLFVKVPWTSWIKAEDFLLDRVLHNDPQCRRIDPHDSESWPRDLKNARARWPTAWLPGGASAPDSLLQRLSFMFGQPYSVERLHPSLTVGGLERFFGPLHLGLYLHATQMVRRGLAARFDAPDILHGSRTDRRAPRPAFENDLDPTHFRDKRVTLLAAGSNHLWHRESIDLMYDWLRSIDRKCDEPSRFTKRVFPGYNLQELMWGERARQDVFPFIAEAIRPGAGTSLSSRRRAVSG